MKRLLASMFLLGLATLVGCTPATTKQGGPGATNAGKVTGSPGDNAFTLDLPMLETDLKQGETKDVKIGVKRGTNFDQDVTLKFEDMPKGVSVEPASPVIKAADKDTTIKVKAADDAAVNHYKIKVVGHPAKGEDAPGELKVEVKKK